MSENINLMKVMQTKFQKLSKGQKIIAQYIMKNYDKAAFMTAAKLGKTVGVSESTVVRFAIELGYEGSMLRKDAPYEQKRSKTLLKRKDFKDAEFECVRIEEGLGNWAGLAKRVVCRLPDGREFGAGIRGTQARAKELLNETHKQVTVRFFDYTPDGIPRFPVVTAFWADGRDM